jgi:DNA topoisomerase-1
MNKTLVIVESPKKAKTISKFLNENYIVKACQGHITDLAKGGKHGLGVDIKNDFRPKYVLQDDKVAILAGLMEAANQCDQILLASDEDREGESISWHLQDRLKDLNKPIQRIVFNEITKKAVQQAIKKTRDVDVNLFHSQEARRILDRLVGFMASPFLMNTYNQTLSAGRVQSVVVRMVIDREREIEQFKPEEFWTLMTNLTKDKKNNFLAKYYSSRITNKSDAMKIKSELEGKEYIVSEVDAKEELKFAPPPMITSTLQRVMSKTFGVSAEQTMHAAQSLYENGHCTYIRTDSVRAAPEAIDEVRNWLKTNNLPMPSKANTFKNKNSAQDAHECIRPTDLSLHPNDNVEMVDSIEQKVYAVIWKHFVASQMTPAAFDTMKIVAQVEERPELQVKAIGKALKSKGFLEVLDFVQTETGELNLPQLSIGERLYLFGKKPVQAEQKFTQPPPRYSEEKLIKELDNKNIGRPSTYAELLSKITARNYVEKQGSVFHATELGKKITDTLIQFFDFLQFDYTAELENKLDQIAEGKQNHIQMLREFFVPFKEQLNKAYVSFGAQMCEQCNSPMVVKTIRDGGGKFLGCTGFPSCRNIKTITERAS